MLNFLNVAISIGKYLPIEIVCLQSFMNNEQRFMYYLSYSALYCTVVGRRVKHPNKSCATLAYRFGKGSMFKIILLGIISIVCIARTSGKTDYWTANQDDETERFLLSVRMTLPWIVFRPQGRAQR